MEKAIILEFGFCCSVQTLWFFGVVSEECVLWGEKNMIIDKKCESFASVLTHCEQI